MLEISLALLRLLDPYYQPKPCVYSQHMVASFHDQFIVDLRNARVDLNTLETGLFETVFLRGIALQSEWG